MLSDHSPTFSPAQWVVDLAIKLFLAQSAGLVAKLLLAFALEVESLFGPRLVRVRRGVNAWVSPPKLKNGNCNFFSLIF